MIISVIVVLLIFSLLITVNNALENNNDKKVNDIADNDEIEIIWGHKDLNDINVPLRFFTLGYIFFNLNFIF